MVKIKTSPENKNRVTISDLNSNIIKLTKVMQESATLNKAYINDIQKARATSSSSSSSSKKSDPSWYAAAGQEMWNATASERKPLGSTIIGGLTGINPAIVQKMGIDRAVGSIFKSLKKDIKEKWAAAGLGASNNKKVNSAIEANKVSPVTNRLDKIIKLMGVSKKTDAKQKTEEKGFLGKLFSFLGSILGPLLKIAAAAALIAGIARAVKAIARWFGWKPGKNPSTDIANTNALKDAAKLGRAGYEIGKGKVLNKARDIAELRSTKKTAEAGALLKKVEEEAKRVEKARALSAEAREAGNIKRAERLDDIANAKEAKVMKDADRIRKLEARAAKDAAFARRVEQIKNSRGLLRTGAKVAGGFAVGTGIDAAASELAAYYLDKEGHHVEAESLRRQYKAVIPYNAIGTIGGGVVGGVAGGASTAGVGASGGAIAGANIGYAATDLTISELVRAKVNADTYKKYGVALPKPDHAEISPFRAAGDWHYYTYDQLQRNATAPSAKDELKRVWKRFNSEYYQDKEYEGHGLIDMLPNGFIKDWAYRLDHGIGTFFSALPETAGIGTAYLKNWWNGNSSNNTSLNTLDLTQDKYPHSSVYGLTTDFNAPIQAADIAESPVVGIEQNTNTTNSILKDILSALETGQASAQRANFGQLLETSELRRTMGGGNSGDKFPPNVRG